MARKKRLFVDAEAEIIDPQTGRILGMLYRWNTGQTQKQWLTKERPETFKLRHLKDRDEPDYAS